MQIRIAVIYMTSCYVNEHSPPQYDRFSPLFKSTVPCACGRRSHRSPQSMIFLTTSSNACCTPSLVLADVSRNSVRCFLAKRKPSSRLTSRAAWSILLPTIILIRFGFVPYTSNSFSQDSSFWNVLRLATS